MSFKILKRSLKSKKSINFILLVFIFLAVMFIAGSVNNLIIIMGGTEGYFDNAGVDDYIIISAMGGSIENPLESDMMLEEHLDNSEYVNDYTVDDTLFAGQSQIKKADGSAVELNGTVMITAYNIEQQKFFDENNKEIVSMEDGTIYLPRKEFENNDLSIGDVILFKLSDGSYMELTIAGICKDAFLGSDMMGTHRFIVSENDMDKLLYDGTYLYTRLYSIECGNLDGFASNYAEKDFPVVFDCDRATIKTTYILDMIVAAVFMLASILLVIISVIILRFAIVFTVNEEYKEIGIMKAIGITDIGIRKLYVTKYFVIAIAGALMGFGGSIPFSSTLIKSAMKNMVLENDGSNIILQFVISLIVAAVVVLFAYLSTGKIKKITPMDAIRSGNNGERFKKKGLFKLGKSKIRPTTFMAINDVLCDMKKFLILLFATIIGVWMVIMPINSINTLRSENIADWFSVLKTDMVITNQGEFSEAFTCGDKQAFYNLIDKYENILAENGYEVKNGSMELGWNAIKVRKDENVTKTMALQGLGTDISDYVYVNGVAPYYENEIAMTHVVAKRIGVDLGDTVYVTVMGEEKPYIVTAIYQSMNNMGEGIRFTESVELDYSAVSLCFGLQYNFVEDFTYEEKNEKLNEIQTILKDCGVSNMKEYINSMIGGVSDRLVPIKIIMLIIVMIINVLIVMLMQKMFLFRERGEMAMLKSVGFSNGKIINWQAKRIMLVLFIGVLIGTITGTPFSQFTAGQVFKYMGASKIKFEINVMEVYVIYPVAIFVASVLICILTMQNVRKVNVNDMNEIE